MKANKTDKAKLQLWQDRLAANETKYAGQTELMDRRERQYRGDKDLAPIVRGERTRKAVHVRNISAELIEAQVSSSIPQPKVTARRQRDERLAKIIEDMLRNELDRLPFEQLNDMMERTVPIQGGAAFLVEWDNNRRTHETVGELVVSTLHPKVIVPQDGVYSGIEDMDYVILKLPQTKEYIRRRYGVDVRDESERDPDVKGLDADTAEDMVTQCVAYYRNGRGGIGLYSWVGDVQVEDIEDYQARRLRRCAQCGAVEAQDVVPMEAPTLDGVPEGGPAERKPGSCPYCGGTRWEDSDEEFEELWQPVIRSDGSVIPGAVTETAVTGEVDAIGLPIVATVEVPTRVPYYKPDIYPVILQKNVSLYGSFLGDSDLDKIADQQNTVNRIESKIIDKLLASGSYITLPDDASIKVDTTDMKVIRPGNAAAKALIGVYDLEGSVSQDMAYLEQVYEEARQVIGITDSFQGRRDTTATSGKAKEFAAAQSAGRLESKRVMKEAAYAALFEAMFKFKLAYADEPRPVVATDDRGDAAYEEFNRYDFLEQDAAGGWKWNDQFLFSCDTSTPLANNREAMWQETLQNLQAGTFGDPTSYDTLVLYWTRMEQLHYPGAGDAKDFLEHKQAQQQAQQQMMQAQQMQAQLRQASSMMDSSTASAVMQQAQADAAADAGMSPQMMSTAQ